MTGPLNRARSLKVIGKIFITRTGYDPQKGKYIKDPYLGDVPSIGACRTDFRKQLNVDDHIFLISGKVKGIDQFVVGGFQIAEKMHAMQAYHKFPQQRLHQRDDGQLSGNIIVNGSGMQHELDDHSNFDNRIQNYVIGKNKIALETDDEIERGRKETMEALQEIMKKKGNRPIDVVGRWGSNINERQIMELRDWLSSIKQVH